MGILLIIPVVQVVWKSQLKLVKIPIASLSTMNFSTSFVGPELLRRAFTGI